MGIIATLITYFVRAILQIVKLCLYLLKLLCDLLTIFGSPREIIAAFFDEQDYSEFTMSVVKDLKSMKEIFIPNLSSPEVLISKKKAKEGQEKTRWYYLNGICTSKYSCLTNISRLEGLFDVPVTGIHNPSNSFLLDLFECASEKLFGVRFRISAFALRELYHTLRDVDIEKVVLVTHSQGTIIGAHLLEDLGNLEPTFLKKLEIYQFANCCSTMRYTALPDRSTVPYMESIGNRRDTVAELGMFAPVAFHCHIDGPKYVNDRKDGHLLDICYLDQWDRVTEYTLANPETMPPDTKRVSKLYEYLP
jgi:hypothetical protein